MSYKDTLNRKMIVIVHYLTTEEILSARKHRNWEEFDKLDDVQRLQVQLDEFSIYEDVLDSITDSDFYTILKGIRNSRFT